jgi:hypothetical protein
MTELSITRLYILRATYLFMVIGMAATIWPTLISPGRPWAHMSSVALSMFGALSILAALGIRYPVQMLPVMFFELIWKVIWLGLIALPKWLDGSMDGAFAASAWECLLGLVLFPIVIPWRFVLDQYVRAPGAPWRSRSEEVHRAAASANP